MTIFELLTANNFVTYFDKANQVQDYKMEAKFPTQKSNSLTVQMVKGRAGLPVVLEPSAFDANPTLREKVGISKMYHDLPFFREADRYGEKEIMDMNDAVQLGRDNDALNIMQNLFDYQGELVRGAFARLEQMRWQVVLTGGISVQGDLDKQNNSLYRLNFDDASGTWASNNVTTLTGDDKWDAADAEGNPIEDIEDIITDAKDNGVELAEAYMNTTTFRAMMNHPTVTALINPNGVLLTNVQKEQIMSDYLGIKFIVYDGRYSAKNETTGLYETFKFIPDGVVSLQPAGTLGKTYMGATPESLGVIQSPEVQMTEYKGLSILRYQEGLAPINHMYVVSFLGMPSFEAMDSVYKLVAF